MVVIWSQLLAKVNINRDRNNYKLRWSCLGKRYSLSIGIVSKESLKAAKAKAKLIESDILFDRFDTSLGKYSIKHQKPTQTETLLTIWKRYKQLNSKRVALTTQKNCWSQVDRCLDKVTNQELFDLSRSDELVNELLNYYSPGTIKRVLISLNAASQGCYYKLNKLPKTNKPIIECFSDGEVRAIIEAFDSDEFKSIYSAYSHSYYTNYVSFLAYTGCRPEEAISLEWHDVELEGKLIKFDKAYSDGILKITKNNKIRSFPINEQLGSILNPQRTCINSGSNLVFPSVSNSYINHGTWNRRYWKPVVNGLVNKNKIRQYLKPYCLRHSFITRCIRSGVDIATVAKLAGTSTEMVMRNYLAGKDTTKINLPTV